MRRKEERKAAIAHMPNCWTEVPPCAGHWHNQLGNQRPLVLELGCGKGDFALQFAALHPDRQIIGIDIKRDRLWYGATRALANGLDNAFFLRADIYMVHHCFGHQEVDQLWITFPDPYPKAAHQLRRMTSPHFLAAYRQILRPNGQVHFKTDDAPLFDYSLLQLQNEQLLGRPLYIHHLVRDLHSPQTNARVLPPAAFLETAYEVKFKAEHKPIHYLCWSFEAGPEDSIAAEFSPASPSALITL
jgi:tRNA (guanine-N7-)-methyltransferase